MSILEDQLFESTDKHLSMIEKMYIVLSNMQKEMNERQVTNGSIHIGFVDGKGERWYSPLSLTRHMTMESKLEHLRSATEQVIWANKLKDTDISYSFFLL